MSLVGLVGLLMPRRGIVIAALCAMVGLAMSPEAETANLRVGGTGAALGGIRALAGAYTATHPNVTIEVVPSLGSSGGIKALLSGALDIALSARPLKPEEQAAGATSVAYASTAVVLVAHPDAPVVNLSTAEIADIYAGAITHWSDGSPIRLVMRQPNETDMILLRRMSPAIDDALAAAFARPGLITAMDDQENVETIERLPGALGVAALAQIQSESRRLKVLAVDGTTPGVDLPSHGDYPLHKTFLLVAGRTPTRDAVAFMGFVCSHEGRALLERSGHRLVAADGG